MRQLMQGLEQGKPPLCLTSAGQTLCCPHGQLCLGLWAGSSSLAFPSEPPADGQEGQDV